MKLHQVFAPPVVAACLLALHAAPAAAGDSPGRGFGGLWQSCTLAPGLCFGYRLTQEGERVCGSLTRVSLGGSAASAPALPERAEAAPGAAASGPAADGPAHGHIRGRVQGEHLVDVFVCGVESRSACPTILWANRRGLLLCGDKMYETGGRRFTCRDVAERQYPQPLERVSAAAFDERFGPAPPSLCERPVTDEPGARVPKAP